MHKYVKGNDLNAVLECIREGYRSKSKGESRRDSNRRIRRGNACNLRPGHR